MSSAAWQRYEAQFLPHLRSKSSESKKSRNANELLELPESFGRLVSLEELSLAENQLESLPSFEKLGSLRKVQSLADWKSFGSINEHVQHGFVLRNIFINFQFDPDFHHVQYPCNVRAVYVYVIGLGTRPRYVVCLTLARQAVSKSLGTHSSCNLAAAKSDRC